MAMDFGLSTALSGFFGSGDQKVKKDNELSVLQNFYTKIENKKNTELQLGMQMEQFQQTSMDLANEVIMKSGIREKDRQAIQKEAEDLRQELIEDGVRKSGSILKFLRGGGYKKLTEYKTRLLGSEHFKRLQSNATAFDKIYQASQDPKTAHLIMERDKINLARYQAGEIDHLTWGGTKGEYEIKELIGQYQKDQRITPDMVIDYGNNANIIRSNIEREYGLAPDSITQEMMTAYVAQELGEAYGTKEIQAAVGTEMYKGYKAMDSVTTKVDFDQNLRHDVLSNEIGTILNSTSGYDGTWDTEWKRGSKPKSSGRVATAGNLQEVIASLMFTGGNRGEWDAEDSKVSGLETKGAYDHTGHKFGEDDIGFWHAEGDTLPNLELRGIFMGQKVTGIGPDGEPIDQLMVDVKDPKKRAELKKLYEGKGYSVQPVMLMELRDSDLIRDDLYYKEVPMHSGAFVGELDKSMDINEELSQIRNNNIDYRKKVNRNQTTNKRQMQSLVKVGKIYGDGTPESALNLMTYFGNPLKEHAKIAGVPDKFYPILMAQFMNDESVTNSKDPGRVLLSMAQNFHEIVNNEKGSEMLDVLKHGNIGNYYLWLEQNGFDSEVIRKSAGLLTDLIDL